MDDTDTSSLCLQPLPHAGWQSHLLTKAHLVRNPSSPPPEPARLVPDNLLPAVKGSRGREPRAVLLSASRGDLALGSAVGPAQARPTPRTTAAAWHKCSGSWLSSFCLC